MANAIIRPPRLEMGQLVGIAAPGSPVREEFLSAGEARIEALGFRVRRATNLLRRGRYTAGSPAERAADLAELLADREVRAIWCARGGYGSPHLPPLLPAASLTSDPKLLIGASDITALLLWSLRAGVACLHGPMPAQELARGRVDDLGLVRHLTSPEPYGRLDAPALRALHPGRASGPVTGGCLALVVASLGTAWEVETTGRVLFLEDVDTRPYQIDRMLTQLRQAGKFDGVVAVLFGEMPRCIQTKEQGYTLDEVLHDLTADLGVPVLAGLPCGHTEGVHHPLPFGVEATVDGSSPGVWLDQAVVR